MKKINLFKTLSILIAGLLASICVNASSLYGNIGNQSVSLYNNGYGTTFGSIGNDSVSLYDNGYGTTFGSVGDSSVYLYDW